MADSGAAPSSARKKGGCAMGVETDQVKGQVKEAAGSLTGRTSNPKARPIVALVRPKRSSTTRRSRSKR